MRAVMCAPLVLLPFWTLAVESGAKKTEDGIKFNMDYLEKTWSMKYKSHAVDDYSFMGAPVKRVKLLLEFTKDVDKVKDLQQRFRPSRIPPNADTVIPLWFYCFDDDSVSVAKVYPFHIEGELSGKKGDAVRVWLNIDTTTFKRTRKIEARPGETKETTPKKESK